MLAGSWGSRESGNMIAGSPGVGGMSNSSSSSSGASWRSGTPSPPLFEEGPGVPSRNSPCPTTAHPSHNQPHYPYHASGTPGSTPGGTPIITLDEGIVPDYIEEQHPRKKVSNLPPCTFTRATETRLRRAPSLYDISHAAAESHRGGFSSRPRTRRSLVIDSWRCASRIQRSVRHPIGN